MNKTQLLTNQHQGLEPSAKPAPLMPHICSVFYLRINKAPTKGFEKDVGSKTTHRIMYPESAVDLDDSTHLVLFPFKILDMQWLISIFTTKHITE